MQQNTYFVACTNAFHAAVLTKISLNSKTSIFLEKKQNIYLILPRQLKNQLAKVNTLNKFAHVSKKK